MTQHADTSGKPFMMMVLGAIACALLLAAYLLYGPWSTTPNAPSKAAEPAASAPAAPANGGGE